MGTYKRKGTQLKDVRNINGKRECLGKIGNGHETIVEKRLL